MTKCKVCKEEFEGHIQQIYCSNRCKCRSKMNKCLTCGKLISNMGKKCTSCAHGGSLAHQWKGGRTMMSGYVMVREHEFVPNSGVQHYICEHRLNMQLHLGRKLIKDEIVHHIDFIRDNNKIDNLWLCTKSSHKTMEKTIFELIQPLMERKMIKFNKETGAYSLTTPTSDEV